MEERGHDVESRLAPVRGHLAAARSGIVLGAYRLQKHFVGSDAQAQAKRAIAVIGEKPIVARPQNLSGRRQNGFMPRAADLEVDFMLALELHFAVIEPPGQEHGAIDADELFGGESMVATGVEGVGLGGRLKGHGVHLTKVQQTRSRSKSIIAKARIRGTPPLVFP